MSVFEVDALLDRARVKTGLADFGDGEFLEPLARLVEALEGEARLNDFGRMRAELTLLSGLTIRLRIQEYLQRHPDVRW